MRNPAQPQKPLKRLRHGAPQRYDASVAMTGLLCGALGILPVHMHYLEAVAACRYLVLQVYIIAAGHWLAANSVCPP